MIKVLLADDHALVRAGIRRLLEEARDIQVVAEAADGMEVLSMIKQYQPDVVILDISMPVLDGMDTCKQIKALFPEVRVLILTVHPEVHYAVRLLGAGAMGYVTKRISSGELYKAVRAVAHNEIYLPAASKNEILNQLLHLKGHSEVLQSLTDREVQVFNLLVQGEKMSNIASSLGLSVKTVENHRYHILKKLNLKRTVELFAFAHRNKLV